MFLDISTLQETDLVDMNHRLLLKAFDANDLENSTCTHQTKIPKAMLDLSGFLRSYPN